MEKITKKLVMALMAYRMLKKNKGTRTKRRKSKSHHRNRRQAEALLQEGIDDGLFHQQYCMTPDSFFKLVSLLWNDLEPMKNVARLHCDHLDVETKMMVMQYTRHN